MASNETILVYSVLEDGIMRPGLLPVGSEVMTQWGPRRVVGHISEVLTREPEPTMPGNERV